MPAANAAATGCWTADDAISGTFARVGLDRPQRRARAPTPDWVTGSRSSARASSGCSPRGWPRSPGPTWSRSTCCPAGWRSRARWAPSRRVAADAEGGAGRGHPRVVRWRRRRRHRAERQRPRAARGGPVGRRRRHRGGLRLLPGRRREPPPRRGVPPQPRPHRGQPDLRAPRSAWARAGTSRGWSAPSWSWSGADGSTPPRSSPTSWTPPTSPRSSSGSTVATPTSSRPCSGSRRPRRPP